MKNTLKIAGYFLVLTDLSQAEPLRQTRACAAAIAQMAAVFLVFPFEHYTASVKWLSECPQPIMIKVYSNDLFARKFNAIV